MNSEETELIRRLQAGDLEACGPLIDLHVGRLRAFIALKAPVSQLIDEIAHETFLYAFQNIQEFQPGTSFFAWLRAVAWQLLRSAVQRYSREQTQQTRYAEFLLLEASIDQSPSVDPQLVEHLENCLERVPPGQRQLLDLKYRVSCSSEEIAQKYNQSVAWVRTTLFRLRQQIKGCIESKLSS